MIDPSVLLVAVDEMVSAMDELARAASSSAMDELARAASSPGATAREVGDGVRRFGSAARLAQIPWAIEIAAALEAATAVRSPALGAVAQVASRVRLLLSPGRDPMAMPLADVVSLVAELSPAEHGPTPASAPAEPELEQEPQPGRNDGSQQTIVRAFRDDAEQRVAALSDGVLELEGDPGRVEVIDALMRAAHSLKGAARVVRLDPLMALAHAMEDCFVAVSRGRITLTPGDLDALLSAIDAIASALQSGLSEDGRLDDVVSDTLAVHASVLGSIASGARRSLRTSVPPRPKTLRPEAPVGVVREDRVVRVTAELADRLLGLSGEAVVEAQRIGPTASMLTQLRIKQQETLDLAQSLIGTVQAVSLDMAVARLLAELAANVAESQQLVHGAHELLEDHARRATEVASRLYNDVLGSRMRPFRDRSRGLPRMVRDLSRQLGKRVALELRGVETLVDRDVLEKLEAPLGHLVRNALDHGIETREERVAAKKPEVGQVSVIVSSLARGMLRIEVKDDGRGIDTRAVLARARERGLVPASVVSALTEPEILQFLFLPGFSTARAVSDVSGRGVGLDVVRAAVDEIGGTLHVSQAQGVGTSFVIEAPLTRSVLRCLLVLVSGEAFAVPLVRVDRVVSLSAGDVRTLESREYIELDGENVTVLAASAVLGLPGARKPRGADLAALVVSGPRSQVALVVDRFVGEEDLVVRKLDPRLGGVETVLAASTLQDGSLVLIVDVDDVLRAADILLATGRGRRLAEEDEPTTRKRILVIDDSLTVREAERQLLLLRGYDVDTAVDGVDGWNAVRAGAYDLVVTDIDMPRMNGIDLVARMKADEKLARVPVVVVSYKDRDEDRLRGLEAGADAYFVKSSFDDRALLEVVDDLVGRHPA